MRSLAGVLTVLFGLALWLAPAVPAAEKEAPSAAVIDKLIEQLGGDENTRKEAARKLVALGESALSALHVAAANRAADADARLRAAVAAADIYEKAFGEIHRFEGHKGWVCRVVMLSDGKRAVSGGDFLRVWNLETGKEIRHFAPDSYVWGLSASRDGKRVLASRADSSVRLYEVETGKELLKLVGHTGEVWVVGLSPDGKVAVTGAFDRTLRVWDAETGKQIRAFANVVDYPRCIAWSPDGKKVAVGHFTGVNYQTAASTLRIWDVESGRELVSGAGHTGGITAVSWSNDGKQIATSSFDKTLRVWDSATAKERKRITASTQGCDCVTFTPDGKRLVSTGWGTDCSVRVWQIDSGKELVRYFGHTGSALGVAVTPDGKKAISCDNVGVLRLWPLPR
jgi:WD40 repeat protein